MEKDRLIERLNYVMGKKEALNLAELFSELEGGVDLLFNLALSKNENLAFHSAWVLEHLLLSKSDLFATSLNKLIESIPKTQNASCKRHFSKLLKESMIACSKNILPKEACLHLKKTDMMPIVETCFEWLMNPNTKPAVKAHCMDILLFLSKRYKWLFEELPHIIELQMIEGTPGIKNKGNKTLEMLRKNRTS